MYKQLKDQLSAIKQPEKIDEMRDIDEFIALQLNVFIFKEFNSDSVCDNYCHSTSISPKLIIIRLVLLKNQATVYLWQVFQASNYYSLQVILKMREILLIYIFCAVASCLTLQKNPTYSSKLSIQFDYAVTDKTCFYSAQIEVFWNQKQIMYAKPWDYDIHSPTLKVQAVPGKNVLAFAGRGHSDGRGVAIANVRVLRDSSYGLQDLAWNGDFTETYEKKKGNYFKIFKKGIQGWKGKQIEVGYGQLYNYNWPVGTIVSELDANQNTQIQQTFYFWNNFEVFYEVENKDLAA